MNTNKTIFIIIILIFSITSYGQYNVGFKPQELDSFKNNTLYVTLGDKNALASKPYIDMIKNTWTFCKVEFIYDNQSMLYLNDQSLFLDINSITTSTTMSPPAGKSGGIFWNNTYFYLRIWKSGLNKKKDPIQRTMAMISLFTDYESIEDPTLVTSSDIDYSKQGHIRNWSVGILKNYLQTMQMILEGKSVKLDGYRDKAELDKLRTGTLYIPDYTFIKFNKHTGDETKRFEESDIMKDYDFQYKIVTSEELSQKILDTQNPVYYLVYVKNSTAKYISVVNSQTGKIVYAYGDLAGNYNIKSSDLKDLSRTIKK